MLSAGRGGRSHLHPLAGSSPRWYRVHPELHQLPNCELFKTGQDGTGRGCTAHASHLQQHGRCQGPGQHLPLVTVAVQPVTPNLTETDAFSAAATDLSILPSAE